MNLKTGQFQIQRPILAPVMQQSIYILMMSNEELTLAIDQELQNNPLLESELKENNQYESNVLAIRKSLDHAKDVPLYAASSGEDDDDEGIPIPQIKSLEEHLLTQLHLEITCPIERNIGELIIGNLNGDGYLTADIDEIGHMANSTDLSLIEKVLHTIQLFEPMGIASRNLEECLIIQINNSESPLRDVAAKIVAEHLKDLCNKRFEMIAQKLECSIQVVKEAAQFIATLEPKPARNYQTMEQTYYIQPDIFVYKNSDETYRVEINKKEAPAIRINPLYQKLRDDKSITEGERKFVQEKLTNAINFIKSIQQRGETIANIAKYIVEHQTAFFDGNTSALSPMSLKEIAIKLGRNESTISRAIHNKYMDTPQGIFALKFFFSQAVNELNNKISSYTIKEEIRVLVDNENKSSPLSDQDIQNHFQEKGIKLARRTINKYRLDLNLAPSHLRKQ